MGIAVKHITAPVPPICELQPDLPPGIEAILDKAMAKKPEERFQTAIEMAEAVRTLVSQPDNPLLLKRPEPLATLVLRDVTPSAPGPLPHKGELVVVAQPLALAAEEPRPQTNPVLVPPARPRYTRFLLAGLLLLLLVTGGFALTNGLTEEPAPSPETLLVQVASPTATVTATLRPTHTATAPPTATAAATTRPTATPSATPAPPAAAEVITITAMNAAAYFTGPDTSYNQLETFVAVDETVTALAQSETGHWLLVENSEGVQGWVARSYFAERDGLDALPVVETILEVVEVVATAAATPT
jgi:serine/threonine-protein kinase